MPRLRGSSSTKPTGVRRARVALQLADDHLAAGAGADDQHLACLAARVAPRIGRSTK